jgi:hypothetical protein
MIASKQIEMMVQKYPEPKILDSSHPCCDKLKPVYIDKLHGNHKFRSHAGDIKKLNSKLTEDDLNEQKVPIDEAFKPQVSGCGLKPPPMDPGQTSIQFDMSKDEWTLGELLELKITEIPFLVEKLLPLHTLNVLAGQSERGKSTFYTQLALAIIQGNKEFVGCKISAINKRVLVISTEDGPIALAFRTNKQLKQIGEIEKFKDQLTFITNQDDLENRIEKHLEKNKVDLIVMDAFADVYTGGDINSSNAVRRYLNTYTKFTQKYSCTVLFVHHVGKGKQANKPEKDQLLGSAGIEGKMRNVLMLAIANGQHQLSIAKGNYINREDKKTPLYLNFDDSTLTFSRADGPAKPIADDQNTLASGAASRRKSKPGRKKDMSLYYTAIELHNKGVPQVEIAKRVNRDKSTICNWIKKYNANKGYDFSKVEGVD